MLSFTLIYIQCRPCEAKAEIFTKFKIRDAPVGLLTWPNWACQTFAMLLILETWTDARYLGQSRDDDASEITRSVQQSLVCRRPA